MNINVTGLITCLPHDYSNMSLAVDSNEQLTLVTYRNLTDNELVKLATCLDHTTHVSNILLAGFDEEQYSYITPIRPGIGIVAGIVINEATLTT